ncbi:MAG TPA: hypothetical protein VEI96_12490 [Thermodesulfovibrionales bacterium]|nr:hypothetical protein [Thermodesulfovibrionales bacterium]
MSAITKRQIDNLREDLSRNLTLDFFEDGEINEVLRDVGSLEKGIGEKTLALCCALSHASSSLVPNTLKRIKKASQHLPHRDAERWITHAFDLLDAGGIDAFLSFVSMTDEDSLAKFQNPEGLNLHAVSSILETYLKGISGRELKIAPDRESFTDGVTIYLPPFLKRFGDPEMNFLLYEFMAAHKWAQIAGGTLNPPEETLKAFLYDPTISYPDIETFFRLFQERELATDIYNLLEAIRLDAFLRQELPGLMKRMEGIKSKIFEERSLTDGLSEKTTFVEGLYHYYLSGKTNGHTPELFKSYLQEIELLKGAAGSHESMNLLLRIYGRAVELEGDYESRGLRSFIGSIRPERVSHRIRAERRARKKRIEGIIARLMTLPELEVRERPLTGEVQRESSVDPGKEYLLMKGRLIELDSELRDVIEERGGIPGGILVKGSDFGAGTSVTLSEIYEDQEVPSSAGGIKYDEWDFRRGGYKRKWCSLYEHEGYSGHEPFVEITLRRYGGYVTMLRKKFELLRRETKILRRQRDGEDIDIDAVVEAYSDMRAGVSPGENLLTRLDRDERSIAVLFLLDMSGSTKGWVNQAEKEALVLMSEALDALGDRYAIYGFSGMTRTRCDYYRIKSFEEAYSEKVKDRISGISPKDYTRMGPPIRHSVRILRSVEAKTKLLVTLSDGKPEDWDAYKGDYGIEDTRKALIETRESGIHPFCITIDREAGSYLPHMYGEANYIVIDDVQKLPNRITEIYRRLTT